MRVTVLALSALGVCAATCPAQKRPTGPKQRPLIVAPNPTYPVIQRGGKNIFIDGSLHDWPKTAAILLDTPGQLSGTAHRHWRGMSDLAARGGMLWDEEKLYLWFLIQDDWGRPLPAKDVRGAGLTPPGDCIVLYFDPRRDTRSYGPHDGRKEDREFWIGMSARGQGATVVVRWQRRFATAVRAKDVEARILYDTKVKRYTAEVAIPWQSILPAGMKPSKGLAIDTQIILNDYDSPTDPFAQTRIGWTFGSGPIINPAIYGTLVLVGPTWNSKEPPKKPKLPESKVPSLPDHKYWIDLLTSISAIPATPGTEWLDGKRGELLRTLDKHLAKYPIFDHQQLYALMQREMVREAAGYVAQGAPWFLSNAMREVLRNLTIKHTAKTPSVTALPGRGFLVRSAEGNIAIGPACVHAQRLAPHLDGLIYPNSFDPFDRHDPLSLRVMARSKALLSHISFHLPGYGPLRFEDIVHPGQVVKVGKIVAKMTGTRNDVGKVTPTVGVQLTWPSGFTLVHTSLVTLPDQVEMPKSGRTDVMILDEDHQHADRLIEELKPRVVILEGYFDLPRWSGGLPKTHRLGTVKQVIERFTKLGTEVLLLSPGQEWQAK
ncbi:MAG: sugar-binding protein [Planctomycetota bacterium]|jgi:hypothetical protein|nr:sugar-binding protein [Planctomycetota bacterium]